MPTSPLGQNAPITGGFQRIRNIFQRVDEGIGPYRWLFLKYEDRPTGRSSCVFSQSPSISSALFRVVSVILVPPMILASSRFLPSMSRGVTEV